MDYKGPMTLRECMEAEEGMPTEDSFDSEGKVILAPSHPDYKQCKSELIGFQPVEYKVLIKLDKVPDTACGGLIIRPEIVRDREQIAQERGTVVAVGGRAFEDFGEPKPKVGDRVAFSKYVGAAMQDEKDRSQLWRVVNDKDIHGVFIE